MDFNLSRIIDDLFGELREGVDIGDTTDHHDINAATAMMNHTDHKDYVMNNGHEVYHPANAREGMKKGLDNDEHNNNDDDDNDNNEDTCMYPMTTYHDDNYDVMNAYVGEEEEDSVRGELLPSGGNNLVRDDFADLNLDDLEFLENFTDVSQWAIDELMEVDTDESASSVSVVETGDSRQSRNNHVLFDHSYYTKPPVLPPVEHGERDTVAYTPDVGLYVENSTLVATVDDETEEETELCVAEEMRKEEKRRKNNEASKVSRAKRKKRQENLSLEKCVLESRNLELRSKVDTMIAECADFKSKLFAALRSK